MLQFARGRPGAAGAHRARSGSRSTRRRPTTSWSRRSGAASAPAPSGCLWSRPDAAISREWDIRWSPATSRVGRVVEAGPDSRTRDRHARLRARREVLRRRCAACSAASASHLVVPATRVVPLDQNLARTRRPAGAGRDGAITRSRRAALDGRTASSATACSAGCWRASSSRSGGEPPVVWENNPRAGRRRGRLRRDVDPEHDTRARLPDHLRRQRRCQRSSIR